MKGRSAVAILAVRAALMAPAAASAAGFSWTASSIGEAFAPGHTATEPRGGRLLFAGGDDPFVDAGGTITCCRRSPASGTGASPGCAKGWPACPLPARTISS